MGAGASVDWEAKLTDATAEDVSIRFAYLSTEQREALSEDQMSKLTNIMDPLKSKKGSSVKYIGDPDQISGKTVTAGMQGHVDDVRQGEIRVRITGVGAGWLPSDAFEYLPPPPTIDVMLARPYLIGEPLKVAVTLDERLIYVKRMAAKELEIPERFLQIVSDRDDDDICDRAVISEIQELIHKLRLKILDRLPFDRDTPEGSDVLVDGEPATYSNAGGGFGCSSRICFDYKTGRQQFMTKYFTIPRPGVVEWGQCNENTFNVEWVLSPRWLVKGGFIVVRSEASLDSAVMGYIDCGTWLVVSEGCYLDDGDRTPRLHVLKPCQGWVTPYWASACSVLILPPQVPEILTHDDLISIAMLLQEKTVLNAFQQADTDGNGTLSIDEMRSVLVKVGVKPEDVDACFAAADVNKDNVIDTHEFIAWIYASDTLKGPAKKMVAGLVGH